MCPKIVQIIEQLGVKRIVTGHNIMADGKITTKCDGLIHFIDIGMSKSYNGNMAVWACDKDKGPVAIYPKGQRVGIENVNLEKSTLVDKEL